MQITYIKNKQPIFAKIKFHPPKRDMQTTMTTTTRHNYVCRKYYATEWVTAHAPTKFLINLLVKLNFCKQKALQIA